MRLIVKSERNRKITNLAYNNHMQVINILQV